MRRLIYQDFYCGIKKASKYLKTCGFCRKIRKKTLSSFVIETVKVREATHDDFGLRYADDINSLLKGSYLFETFPVSRKSLAIKSEWNMMTSLRQWKIKQGAIIIEGRASKQDENLTGGQLQKVILELSKLVPI